MKTSLAILALLAANLLNAQFAPTADQPGTTAIHKDSSVFVNWADTIVDFERGPQDISAGMFPVVSFGDSTAALGLAEGTATDVVSLGDGGVIVLSFPYPIKNEAGPDFAVFENSFSHDYLELAHVEVSTDGITYVRFPSESLTQTSTQLGGFDNLLAEEVHNLAGKYIQGFGTPFDLQDIADSVGVNLDSINFVKIIDVVGSIDLAYASMDAEGNIINDPFPTAFESGGFDLDGIGVIHENNPSLSFTKVEKEVLLFPKSNRRCVED